MELQLLVANGMSIGNHGMHHRPWAALDTQNLNEELVESKNRLEQMLQKPVNEAACPFGSYNRRVLNSLRQAGYGRVYTSDQGPACADAWIQPRNTVSKKQSLSDIKKMITNQPHVLYRLYRRTKLLIKQIR